MEVHSFMPKKIFLKEVVIAQGPAHVFGKGPDTKYFRLCGDRIPTINTHPVSHGGAKTDRGKRMGRRSDSTVFTTTRGHTDLACRLSLDNP